MNFLNKKTTWTNWELIPLKLCIATAYILVGGYFHSFFHSVLIPVILLFGITMIWSVWMWISKMKKEN